MADGYLNFDTKIDDTDFKEGLENMSSSVSGLKGSIKSLGGIIKDALKVDTSKTSSKMMSLEEQLRKAEVELENATRKKEEFANTEIKTEEYVVAEKEVDTLTKKFLKLLDAREKFEETGGNKNSQTYKKMQYDIDTVDKKLEAAESEVSRLNEEGKKFKLGSDTEKFSKFSQDVDNAQGKVNVLKQRIGELAEKEENAGKSGTSMSEKVKSSVKGLGSKLLGVIKNFGKFGKDIGNVGNSLTKKLNLVPNLIGNVGGKVDGLGKKLGGMVKRVFVFSMMTKALRALRTAFQDVISADGEMSNLIAQIKGNLLTAFAPLYNFVLPAIKSVLSAFVTFSNYLANVMSSIFGKTIAQSTAMAKSLYKNTQATDKNTKASKKNAKAKQQQLASYDELNVMQDTDSGSDSGSSGSGSTSAPIFNAKAMDVPIVDQIKKLIKSGDWEGIGKLVANKLNNALKKIQWKSIQKTASDIASKLARTLNGFFSVMDLAKTLGNTVAQALNTGLRFAYTFLTTFDFKQFGTFIGESINSFVQNFKWGLLGKTLGNAVQGAIDTAYGFVTTYAWGSFAEGIAKTVNKFFKAINWTELGQTIGIAVVGALTEISTFLQKVKWDKIGKDIGTFLGNINWESIIAGVFTIIGNAITASFGLLKGTLTGLLNNGITPVKAAFIALGTAMAGMKIAQFISNMLGALGVLRDITAVLIKSTAAWVKNNAQVVIATIKTGLQTAATKLLSVAQKALNFVMNLNPMAKVIIVITALVAAFVVLWNKSSAFRNFWIKAWNDIKSAVAAVWKAISPILNNIWNGIKAVWDKMKPFVTFIVNTFAGAFKSAFNTIKGVVNSITTVLSGIITFLGGVFSGDWKKAWEGIKQILKGIWNGIKSIVKDPINAILGFINYMIKKIVEGLNFAIEKLNSIKIEPPKWFQKLTGIKKFGLNIKKLPVTNEYVHYLANGAVIPPNNEFMAVLGDQKKGVNIESPLSTIVDAFRQVQGENTTGISDKDLLNAISNMQVNVIVQQDSRGVFNMVKQEVVQEQRRTGKPVWT